MDRSMSSPRRTQVRSASAVGLDIGSSAVRAAEVTRSRRGLTIQRFAQVGLPGGAVVDGEILDPGAVTVALRRLWSEGGFTTRNVVLAISGQRVIVRQAEVVAMSESDFRSALRFQAMDLIPIPIDDALLDFVILPPADGAPKQTDRMQILLAAAHRSVVDGHLGALREASLHAVAVDPAPMAAIRAIDQAGPRRGTTAVIDIGADLTLVALGEGGRVRFSRILNTGGSDLTASLAGRLSLDRAVAEGAKRQASSGGAAVLLAEEVDPLVSEIVSSLAFFESQLGSAPLEVLLTGGPSRSPELIAELAQRLSGPVSLLDPLSDFDVDELGLTAEALAAAASTALLPIGAAEWAFEQPGKRLSLLPKEMAAAAEARRKMIAMVAGVAVLAGGLALITLKRSSQVSSARNEAAQTVAANQKISDGIARLAPVTQLSTAVHQRLELLQVDGTDNVAWSPLLAEISAAMPPNTRLASVSFNGPNGSAGTTATAGAASGGTTSAVSGPLGSVTMAVTGKGSEDQVADWLRALRHVRGLEGVWVPSATDAGGVVTFSSTGGLTTGVPMVQRSTSGGAG
jgi:type IV pilus assembly protein PilM